MKIKLKIKVRFFHPKDAIPIVDYLAKCKDVSDAIKMREGAAMLIFPCYVNEKFAKTLINCTCVEDQ